MTSKTMLVKNLKPGIFISVDGEPCKVASITTSKAGKHGSAKARVEVVGVFDNKRRFLSKPVSATVETPTISKCTGQVISVSGDIVQLMDLADYSTFETTIPGEMKGKLTSGAEVTYWKVGSRIMLRELK